LVDQASDTALENEAAVACISFRLRTEVMHSKLQRIDNSNEIDLKDPELWFGWLAVGVCAILH
jgi:hypothetical protein